jgi:PPP family 3-phenylpropionic acid transporter
MPERQSRDIVANEPSKRLTIMTVERGALLRFMTLYAALFVAFGFASPFLPAFLAEHGLSPEELGFVLGASTALQLVCGPIAGRLGDRLQAFRAELAVCAILAAGAAFLYLAAYGFWTVMAVRLLQAAALAPLVPLADALSLAHATPRQNTGGFEYGWVRGMGSAAFVAGTLLAGQAAADYGLSAIIWLSATALLATPIAARFVPGFPENASRDKSNGEIPHRPWLTLLRQRAFVRVTLVASLVLGSHAMYDSFAVICWTQAGITPATIGVLWAESVAAEVVVLLFLGPRLLRVITPTVALAVSASCGLMRWAVLAQTADVTALGLVQPLHGFTFALLHLASMRIITDTVQRTLAATAQAVYGLVGVGGGIAVLTLLSGWLYARFGPAGFWAMGALCAAAFPVIWLLHQALVAFDSARLNRHAPPAPKGLD